MAPLNLAAVAPSSIPSEPSIRPSEPAAPPSMRRASDAAFAHSFAARGASLTPSRASSQAPLVNPNRSLAVHRMAYSSAIASALVTAAAATIALPATTPGVSVVDCRDAGGGNPLILLLVGASLDGDGGVSLRTPRGALGVDESAFSRRPPPAPAAVAATFAVACLCFLEKLRLVVAPSSPRGVLGLLLPLEPAVQGAGPGGEVPNVDGREMFPAPATAKAIVRLSSAFLKAVMSEQCCGCWG